MGDPYSEYYTPEEYQQLMNSLTGSYAGIGATMAKDEQTGAVTLGTVYPGSPAEKAGLKAGDTINKVGDQKATEMDLEKFTAQVRGDAGTQVQLDVTHSDGREEVLTLTRALVDIPTVSYQMATDKIGYVRIDQFTDKTYDAYMKAMDDLKGQGMHAVIFDLRSNPGGLRSEER